MFKNQKGIQGFAQGYRSGLEEQVGIQLEELKVKAGYETEKISYTKPSRSAKYTPDWILENGVIVETKGRFMVADRQKHLLIKEQHPEIDIRFVFSYSKSKISKGSKTTYAMWCQKHGFLYADKLIPKAWTQEPRNEESLAALQQARPKK